MLDINKCTEVSDEPALEELASFLILQSVFRSYVKYDSLCQWTLA